MKHLNLLFNTNSNRGFFTAQLVAVAINLLLSYACYAICRLAFLAENWSAFGAELHWGMMGKLLRGAMLFDTSAVFYTNSLYLLLVLLPLHKKAGKAWHIATRIAFVLPNALAIVLNLMDSAYFSFTEKRIMANVFAEFKNDNNLGGIIGVEFLHHWYFVLIAVAMIWALWRLFRRTPVLGKDINLKTYYACATVQLVVAVPCIMCCMRGALFSTATRPVAVSNAMSYVEQPLQANIILNTPFSLIRTAHNKPAVIPTYFTDQKQLDQLYTPVHMPDSTLTTRRKNVVVLIVESFAAEFIGAMNNNRALDGGKYRGYTPFADSLIAHSLTFEQSFCNTWTSIDAMPAVLASIPHIDRPFVLTPYSLNKLNSLPNRLGKLGYETAFFHGAENASMGFHAFADAIGFKHYYGRSEYEADKKLGGTNDFDGTWGIWDEPFLQYFCNKMTQMQQPFMTAVFTLSSHHPFNIPDKYKNVFLDEGKHKLHKCIRYTDYSLRRFFETASKQPWYKNTIFVLCADHASSKTTHDVYQTELAHFRVPVIFFDPSGEMPRGVHKGIAQQIDIMPTVLGWIGYDKPYIAFGIDLLRTKPEDTWMVNWHSMPMYVQGDKMIMFDTKEVVSAYNYLNDPLMHNNLKGKIPEQNYMEQRVKAFLQSYNERMRSNQIALP